MDSNLIRQARIKIGRESFYNYCIMRLPSVFTVKRKHLKILCNRLQEFWESDTEKNLMILMPPRHGKTLTVELLVEWGLGKRPDIGIITASYNETLSSRFSKQVRNGIQERSAIGGRLVFSDFFPGVKIKDGDGAMQLWALEGSHFSFLATSPGGTATGIGGDVIIVDDLIKSAEEANNPRVLEGHRDWYYNTLLSRLEAGGKKLIINTRWATGDISGVLLALEPEKWHVFKMPAQNPDGTMLCDDILSLEEYEDRKTKTDPVIIAGNYQQEPYDSIDKLYGVFKTYNTELVPDKWERIESYADTADGGGDSFASFVYGIHKGYAYILDCVFTQEGMEQTEIKHSRMLMQCNANTAYIESNNGGAGFARNVEKRLRADGNTSTAIRWFHQSGNKEARILTNAYSVQNVILWPVGWRERWPMMAKELEAMGRAEKWKHDDAADALTGIIEKSLTKQIVIL